MRKKVKKYDSSRQFRKAIDGELFDKDDYVEKGESNESEEECNECER